MGTLSAILRLLLKKKLWEEDNTAVEGFVKGASESSLMLDLDEILGLLSAFLNYVT